MKEVSLFIYTIFILILYLHSVIFTNLLYFHYEYINKYSIIIIMIMVMIMIIIIIMKNNIIINILCKKDNTVISDTLY
jgi:hypothetical protein